MLVGFVVVVVVIVFVGGVCGGGDNRCGGRGKPPPLRKLGSVRCFGSDGRNGDVDGAPSVRFRVKAYYMSGKTALYGNYGSVSGKTAAK